MKNKFLFFALLVLSVVSTSKLLLSRNNALIVPGAGTLEKTLIHYQCDNGHEITVNYLNKGENTLAIIPVAENKKLIFSGAVTASGAAYSANQYLWHEKNKQGILENILTKKTIHCSEK